MTLRHSLFYLSCKKSVTKESVPIFVRIADDLLSDRDLSRTICLLHGLLNNISEIRRVSTMEYNKVKGIV